MEWNALLVLFWASGDCSHDGSHHGRGEERGQKESVGEEGSIERDKDRGESEREEWRGRREGEREKVSAGCTRLPLVSLLNPSRYAEIMRALFKKNTNVYAAVCA